ncbi:MAG TPA: prolipoprotein diacylglyceryl transferase [Candidatus Scybalocola faecavium]|nr:prolipoprotein diacylglyceryl transferase [Candidatus Scybalocola faecavium]
MYNDLFTIGNITVHGYGLMIGIGIIAAYLMTEHLAKKKAMDPDPVFSLLIFGVLGGIAGAKILYWITIFDEIIRDPAILWHSLTDGFVVYGGIIGGILAGYAVCRIKKISFWDYLDCATPSIALAQGFGRIGCFLAGCCYGMETDSWCAITFTNSQFAPNHVPLVPTQIFSSVFDFAHFVLLYVITRRSKVPGFTSSLYLIIYGVGRFVIEFFRGDLIRGSVGALSTSQFISIFIVAFGVVLMVKKLRDSKRDQIAQENTRDEEEKVENVKENH